MLQSRLAELSEESRSLQRKSTERDRRTKLLLEARQNLLRDLDREIIASTTPMESIFISFSGVGKGLGEIARKVANQHGLHVKTGFDAEIEVSVAGLLNREESLANSIMAHILSCDCFIGIWTDDFDCESKEGVDMRNNWIEKSRGYVPSVWMPFELGVAASHNLPFRLLVIKGTHRLYYEKPFQFQPQMVFEREVFEGKVERVIDYLARKVRARRRH